MSGHGYESGRLNLPFVGLCSFGKYPYQPDWDSIDADFAILGAPFDFGTQFRAGARFGPRGVREASTLFSFGHAGAYDHEDDVTYLENDKVRIVDIGDADIVHTDTVKSHANIEAGVRAILAAGAVPVVIGGDHSVNIPASTPSTGRSHSIWCRSTRIWILSMNATACATAMATRCAAPPKSPMSPACRRSASATCHPPPATATRMRADGLRHRLGAPVPQDGGGCDAGPHPEGARYYVTIDIDGFDPSIAAGTGTPSHGGFLYYEVLEFLDGLTRRGNIVGVDLVEVAPDYDLSGSTTTLAAQLLLNLIGRIAENG